MVKGVIHVTCGCYDCDWQAHSKFPDIGEIRKEAKTHSKETGHNAWVETGEHTDYKDGVVYY